ncbi:GH3 auxin-responsive promoter [Boletus edulis BED1]|uniref:GH3 auxin-responsive promoter n=1 Tax=Boletus edulis BED1 TaxID=1328754 RepID=A0AAD4G7E2_BOLED|nr:GH3 auxin-responsive promoter [Boletus edulis BED1]
MPLPDLLLHPLPSLSEQLRRRSDELRSRIIRANYNTQFAQTVPELADFRRATAGHIDGMDDDILSESFRKTVQLTTYDLYAPFIARFFEQPCKASAIVDLLAPGLPDCLSRSSSTSGGLPKYFPKYNRLSKIRSSNVRSWTISDPLRRRTTACVLYFGCDRVDIEDEDNCSTTTIYVSSNSTVLRRMQFYLDPDEDEEKMGTFILDHAAPYAASFIKKWRSCLLIHGLFALGSRSLESMIMVFVNTFVDMIHHLDTEFDTVVDCIANGTIPDFDGVAEFRRHLEVNIVADPERAAELRRIGRPSSRPGWCGHVWPNLRSVHAIASGSFASSVPLAQWFLGPDAAIRSLGLGATECWIGASYSPLELNQFKLNNNEIIELLDISKDDSTGALAQPWEVELGKRYELVLTTRDGLWRYRLGDVVEICGFDPTDGVPIIRFVERRNMTIRFPNVMFTEEQLRAAISSAVLNIPVKVINWTAAIDGRSIPATIGFFVELAGSRSNSSANAPQRDKNGFKKKKKKKKLKRDTIRKPTIRLLRSGTFSNFLQMKLDEGSRNNGQVKVPVVLPKAAYVTWFENRVVQEF